MLVIYILSVAMVHQFVVVESSIAYDLLEFLNHNDLVVGSFVMLQTQDQCEGITICQDIWKIILTPNELRLFQVIPDNKILFDEDSQAIMLIESQPWKRQNEFSGLIKGQDADKLSRHMWIIILKTNETKVMLETSAIDYVRDLDLNGLATLSVKSQLYIALEDAARRLHLFEVYKVSDDADLRVISIKDRDRYKLIWDRRSDLQGAKLRTTYLSFPPGTVHVKQAQLESDITWNNNIGLKADGGLLKGSDIELLKVLMEDLNFTVEWVKPVDPSFGTFNASTNHWTGIMETVITGRADFSITMLSITKTRSEHVTFSTPVQNGYNNLFMKKPGQLISSTAFVDVFGRDYKIVLLVVCIGYSLLLAFFFIDGSLMHKIGSSLSAVFLAFCSLDTSAGYDGMTSHHFSKKSMFFFLCAIGSLNWYVFNAGLTSILTIERIELPITSLEDLITKPDFQIIVLNGSSDLSYFSEASMNSNPIAKNIFDQFIDANPDALVMDPYEAEEKLLENENYVFFGSEIEVTTSFSNYPCTIKKANPKYDGAYRAIPFSPKTPYDQIFNRRVKIIKESGIMNAISSRLNLFMNLTSCDEGSNTFKPYSYHNIVSAFIVLAAGAVFALFGLVMERCKARLESK